MVTALALILVVAIPAFAWAAGPNHGNGVGSLGGNLLDTFSKLLGMTPAEIQAERIQGKSLAQIAEGKGVTEEKLIQEAMAARKDQIDQWVKDGKMTQTQADYMLSQMETRIKASVERTTVGKPDWAGKSGNGQGFGKGMDRGAAGGGLHGAGGVGQGNGGVCPYVQQDNG